MSSRRDCSRWGLVSYGILDWIIHTDTKMGVDRSITGSTRQVLVLSVWDVEMGLWVTVLLGQTKINHVDLVATLSDAHEEVVGLDITVDERLGVDVFDTRDELIGEEQDSLERELPVAEVEQILETGAEEIKDHGIVVTLCSEPAHEGDADTAGQGLVDTSLIFELGVLGLDALELDGNLLAGDDVGAEIDVTEAAATDLTADAVLVTYTEILLQENTHVSNQSTR